MNHKLRAYLLLFLAALIWGIAFVAQDIAMDSVPPLTFNGARMVLAGLALLPLLFWRKRKEKATAHESKSGDKTETRRALWMSSLWCGLFLFLGSGLQQLGIQQNTGAGKAGFITVLYIVLVPLVGLFRGKRIRWSIWLAVGLCLMGLFLLCVTQSLQIELGDIYLLLCAFCFTGHILVIDHFSRRVDPVRMSCAQFFVCAGLSLAAAALWEQPTWAALAKGIIPILYAGVLSGAVGYTLQIIGQRDTDPAIASLVLCLESVFAALAGWIILGDSLSARELAGCALMFMGILLAQWPEKSLHMPTGGAKHEIS